MNRRDFLATLAAAALSGRSSGKPVPIGHDVHVAVDTRRPLGEIPRNFTGLGYEISSVARSGLLSANDRLYVQLVRTLGAQGVIRVGGNTSDDATFSPHGRSVSAPKGTVVNESDLQALASFLAVTGWKLIWGLNLGSGTEQNAVQEAQAVAAAAQGHLLAFEIGNEPDLFVQGKTPHRPRSYTYDEYLNEYQRYKAAIRSKLPNAPFAGPDAAAATDWVTRFAADEGHDLKLLTHHYYRQCAGPASTLDKLLHTDPKLAPELKTLRAASVLSGVPYRICEANSFCGGGQPGVSDTFGAALWVLDFMFTLAWGGAAGVNIETGVNQLGFVSSYSPIGEGPEGYYSAKPDYYGMLAFAQASRGQRVETRCGASGLNVAAYAVLGEHGQLWVTVINKEPARNAAVLLNAGRQLRKGQVLRLTAPYLTAKTGVTLGGAAVTASGEWTPSGVKPVEVTGEQCSLAVPAASAAIVSLAI